MHKLIALNKQKRNPSKTSDLKSLVAQEVKKIEGEKYHNKFIDTQATATPAYNQGPFSMVLPIQGVTDSNRIGDTIRLTKISCRVYLNGINTHLMRLIIFRWHPLSISQAPTAALILQSISATYAPLSPYMFDTKPLFSVLYDKTWPMDSYHGTYVEEFSLRANWVTKFNTNSATDAIDSVFILYLQDGTLTLNTITLDFRLFYHDES
jgi:hypothetical protein